VTALLGLAIEPLEQIMQEVAALPSNQSQIQGSNSNQLQRANPTADAVVLAERIVKHLFNYLSGFANGNALTPDVAIPMGTIVRWYESFVSKVRNSGVGFLENQEG
jgi:protein Hikeshi